MELFDRTRKHKLKVNFSGDFSFTIKESNNSRFQLQLSKQYPYFNMLLKDIWVNRRLFPSIETKNTEINWKCFLFVSLQIQDEENSGDSEDRSFISDEDLRQFSKLNKNVDSNRIQVRERVKRQFQAWKEKSSRLSMNN